MAASSLAAQLQVVAATGPQEERLKGKASLLYEIKEAADIDLATIYAVGVQGERESAHPTRSTARRLGWERTRRTIHPREADGTHSCPRRGRVL